MIKKNKSTLIITTLVMLIPMIAGLFLWEKLPEQVPFHWNINGEVDDWCSKGFAVFGFPVILMGFHWLCIFACTADPKRKNYNPKMFGLVLWICPALSLLLNAFVYATALGNDLAVETIMPMLVGLMFVIIGNLLPKCRQSYTMGIKLPWTLNNEENWNKTHRFAGKIWVIGGLMIMATAFLGSFWLLMIALLAMCAVPTVYSYLLYRKQEKQNGN